MHPSWVLFTTLEEVDYIMVVCFCSVRLQKLPPELNLQELEEYRDKLKRQQAAVSISLFSLSLTHTQ